MLCYAMHFAQFMKLQLLLPSIVDWTYSGRCSNARAFVPASAAARSGQSIQVMQAVSDFKDVTGGGGRAAPMVCPMAPTTTMAARSDKNTKQSISTPFNMFVDNSLYTNNRENMHVTMAASIESLYMVLCYTDPTQRQSCLSLDKFDQTSCSFERIQLGKLLNTRTMTNIIKPDKVTGLQKELSNHWHRGRKTFTIMEGAKLLGLFENWDETSAWVRFMYHALRISVNNALRRARLKVVNSNTVTTMVTAISPAPNATDAELQAIFLQKKIAKDTYHTKTKINIDKTMRHELLFLGYILNHQN